MSLVYTELVTFLGVKRIMPRISPVQCVEMDPLLGLCAPKQKETKQDFRQGVQEKDTGETRMPVHNPLLFCLGDDRKARLARENSGASFFKRSPSMISTATSSSLNSPVDSFFSASKSTQVILEESAALSGNVEDSMKEDIGTANIDLLMTWIEERVQTPAANLGLIRDNARGNKVKFMSSKNRSCHRYGEEEIAFFSKKPLPSLPSDDLMQAKVAATTEDGSFIDGCNDLIAASQEFVGKERRPRKGRRRSQAQPVQVRTSSCDVVLPTNIGRLSQELTPNDQSCHLLTVMSGSISH